MDKKRTNLGGGQYRTNAHTRNLEKEMIYLIPLNSFVNTFTPSIDIKIKWAGNFAVSVSRRIEAGIYLMVRMFEEMLMNCKKVDGRDAFQEKSCNIILFWIYFMECMSMDSIYIQF